MSNSNKKYSTIILRGWNSLPLELDLLDKMLDSGWQIQDTVITSCAANNPGPDRSILTTVVYNLYKETS